MAEDYCDLCDLPLSTCIHGMPPPPPPPEPAPRTPRSPRATATRAPSARAVKVTQTKPAVISKRTEQEAFRPFIVQLLKEEGALETGEVMELLADRMAEVLLERDKQKAPTGEIRWQTVARAERKSMIDEGLMAASKGMWELTDRGRAATY